MSMNIAEEFAESISTMIKQELLKDKESIRWATVTQASPLRVRLDTETSPLNLTPDTLVSGLQVGERVLCARVFNRVIVLGKSGGVPFATSSVDGLMSKADKALLDNKATIPTPDTLAYRGTFGSIHVETGSSAKDAANKAYVDGYNVLWTGTWHMVASQTATLSQTVSSQKTGIVLAWSAYSGGVAGDFDWHYQFIPKWHVAGSAGKGVWTVLFSGRQKYTYINNGSIVGNDWNADPPNNGTVLRAVIGV